MPESFLDTVINETLKAPAAVWRDVMEGLLSVDFKSSLAKIKCPTLVLYVSNDGFSTLGAQQKLNADLTNSTLRVYEGVGHAPHWQQSAQTANDIVTFVQMKLAGELSIIDPGDYCYD